MTNQLPNLPRLKRMLALALSTDHEREAISALRMMRQHLARYGKDQHWFIEQIGLPPVPFTLGPVTSTRRKARDVGWEEMLDACEKSTDLRYRDTEFIESLVRQRRRKNWQPSLAQLMWLRSVYQRTKGP